MENPFGNIFGKGEPKKIDEEIIMEGGVDENAPVPTDGIEVEELRPEEIVMEGDVDEEGRMDKAA